MQAMNVADLRTTVVILLAAVGMMLTEAWSAGPVGISEFMARNSHTLADEDETHSDWIELHNTSFDTVNLEGWFLTDTTNNLMKWRFPATNLNANAYLVVFASGKDRPIPGAPLHTSFQLAGDGEYLALVMPDGRTIATEFAPMFPPQVDDISYGSRQSVSTIQLVTNQAWARFIIPPNGTQGTNWTTLNYIDASWKSGRTGLGYGTNGIPPMLFSYWPMQEGTGNTASNLVPGSTNGTIFGASWAQDPARGPVLSFNGTNAYVAAGSIPRMGQTDSNFTWSFWYYQNSGRSVNATVLGNRAGGVQSPLQFIKFTPNNFEYYRGGSIGTIPHAVPTNSWRHLAAVKNGSTLTYYDNGLPVGNSRAGGDVEANPFYYGGDPGAPGEYADGMIDDVSLWTAPLTQEQIQALATGVSPLSLFGGTGVFNTDLTADMFGVNSSAFVRIPFICPDTAGFNVLKLRVKYQDGFVAYLNGVEIARRNAPDATQWNSAATAAHAGIRALQFEEIDVSGFLDSLVGGANVLALQGMTTNAFASGFLLQPELEGSVVTVLGDGFFSNPSPGTVNNPGVIGLLPEIAFGQEHGFYDTSFSLALSCAGPAGTTIRYTTDGTAPTAVGGILYTAPVAISRTTVVRAAAFAPGYQSSNVGCRSYLFVRDILSQTGAGFPLSWGSATADYAMDQRVVTNPAYASTIVDDMKSLPVVSIVVDPADFFGPAPRGIYSTPTSQGVTYERPCSAELFFPDASLPGFQINCGLRIAGGASRNPGLTPKHGLRLLFKTEYGASKLDYKFFDNSDLQSFDTIQLRPNFNMSWVRTDNSGPLSNGNADGAERTHALYIRDQFTKDSQLAMGDTSAHERFVHLYLNGLYWGVYNPSEHTDAAFAAAYYGGEKADYDAIFSDLSSVSRAVDGDKNAWNQMLALANAGLGTDSAYAQIQQYLDVTNLADYMMLNFYCSTVDWPWQNWNAARKRETNATFHFFVWDAEYTLETPPWVPADRTNVGDASNESDSPARLYCQLRQNAEWRLLFADRVQKHFFNGGALTTNQTIPRFLGLCDAVDRAIVGESARWGDLVRQSQPYTRDVEWRMEKNRLLTQFFPVRTDLVVQQFKAAGLYPSLDAPSFSPLGTVFQESIPITLSAPFGTVYYTTNGTDPRLPGGGLAPGAVPFTASFILTNSATVLARTFYMNTWSALNQGAFIRTVPPTLTVLRAGSTVVLSWPADATNYQLEATTNLPSGLWSLVPGVSTNSATLPANSPSQFYRLRTFAGSLQP